MTDNDAHRLDDMLRAVDPSRDLSDASIDTLFPAERLEARIDFARDECRVDRRSTARRLQYAVAAGVVVVTAVLVGALARPDRTATIPSALIHVRGTPVASPGHRDPTALHLLSGMRATAAGLHDDEQGLTFGTNIHVWCDPAQLRGSLVGDRSDGRIAGWSGLIRIVNVGPACTIASATAAVQALSPSSRRPLGPAVPIGRTSSVGLDLSSGTSVAVGVAFIDPRIYSANECRARPSGGLLLLGGQYGWPTLRFDLGGSSFGVCTGRISNYVSGTLTYGSRR